MGDIMDSNHNNEPIASPKKKSLFSKAAIAKISEGAKGLDMFSRANELFPQRLEEEQRKKQRKFAKLERKRSSTSAEVKEATPPENKKRRTSGQKGGRDGYSSEESAHNEHGHGSPHTRRESSHTSPGSRISRSISTQHKAPNSPTSLSARYNRDLRDQKAHPPRVAKSYISLIDSDDEDESARESTIPVRKAAAQPIISLDDDDDYSAYAPRKLLPPPEDDESEEEFPELVQAARERERLKAQQRIEAEQSFKEKNHTSTSVSGSIFGDASEAKIDTDPTVNILITSIMDGTKPLMVKRKLSQRLKEAKLGWCDKQPLPEGQTIDEFRNSVFLTWKDHRLFDLTTCRTLGAKFDANGSISHDADGMDSHGNIHLQAWTEYGWAKYQKRKEDKAKAEADGEDIVEKKDPEVQKTKLILKPRELEPFKLVVKPTTTVAKIIAAFRGARAVPEEKDILLYFDGDELSSELTVEETELGDMDSVDVLIR